MRIGVNTLRYKFSSTYLDGYYDLSLSAFLEPVIVSPVVSFTAKGIESIASELPIIFEKRYFLNFYH